MDIYVRDMTEADALRLLSMGPRAMVDFNFTDRTEVLRILGFRPRDEGSYDGL